MQDIDLQSSPIQAALMTGSSPSTRREANEKVPSPVRLRSGAGAGTLLQTAKVMIVDDEPLNIKVVQKHLKLAGYRHFVTSTDPRPVMEMISQETPDVILLDVMMPHISGLAILEKLCEDEQLSHIPTIVLTASDNEATRMEALELARRISWANPYTLPSCLCGCATPCS